MFMALAVQVFVNASILCGILYLIARDEADYSFQKVSMVTAGLVLGSFLIQLFLAPRIGGGFTLLVLLGFSAFMIMTFCWISFWKSMLVVVIFMAVYIGINLATTLVLAKLLGPSDHELAARHEREQAMRALAEAARQQGAAIPDREAADGDGAAQENTGEQQSSISDAVLSWGRAIGNAVSGGDDDASRGDKPPRRHAPPTGPAPSQDLWREARAALQMSGVMRQGEQLVSVINGEMKEAGDIVFVRHDGYIFRWRIHSISENDIQLVQARAERDD